MALEDKMMAVAIRRTLARKSVDLSDLQISCSRGIVTLGGAIKEPREFRGHLDMKDEMSSILELIRRIPGVRDVVNTTRLQEASSWRAKR
ncbi:MAG: BON domain-containing protein [Armatimonadetes bacterium]|nr:BON domain-containing protein [Armatimonadota bacterium]